jgi:hypothetical protein
MKGFTHTLEAIIGSILLISSITLMTSTLQSGGTVDRFDGTLDAEVAEKIDKISISEAEKEIEPLLPAGYNYSAFIRRTDTESFRLDSNGGTDSYYINRTGSTIFLHLFAEGSGYDVTYRGNRIIENGESGYSGFRAPNTSGYLNASDTVEVNVEAVNQSIVGNPEIGRNIDTYNFPVYERSPSEVKVSVWR